jgi:hypothetical protein
VAGAERAQGAEREPDVAGAEPDRERLALTPVGDAADPAAGDDSGREHEAGAECEPAERLPARERASVHECAGYLAAGARHTIAAGILARTDPARRTARTKPSGSMPNRYGRAMTRDVELGEAGGLAHRTAGSGRPLALLGRGPGLDGSVFFPEVVTLTDIGIRVVAVDRPADGRSPAI